MKEITLGTFGTQYSVYFKFIGGSGHAVIFIVVKIHLPLSTF